MVERSAWPWVLIAAMLLPGVAASPCAAQSPPVAPQTPQQPPGSQQPAALPSTVSPVIERFLKQSGRDVPAPRPVETPSPATAPARPQIPAPIPPPTASLAANARAGQSIADRPSIPPPRLLTNATQEPSESETPGRSPLFTQVNLPPSPTERTDLRFAINLATALRLSDARPLIVARAQASVWIAEANLQQARVIWIPGINFAADYLRHDGGGPDFNKGVLTAPSVNFFYAGGGLWGVIATTDALFEPLVARQVVNSRHWDVQRAKNDAVLQTADAYFMVHQFRGTYAGTLYCVQQGHVLIEKLAALSKDLIQEFEVERARNMVADLEQRAVLARQQWRVQSANLTQVLRLDPRAIVEPTELDHLQVTLIEPGRTLEDLMPIAMTNRPEIASRQAMVQSATAAIRREKMRPVLPSVIIGGFQSPGGMLIQGGIFGLGPNSSLNQWTGRDDVSIQLIWQLEYFGFGNLARIKRQRGEQSQATIDLLRAQDMVVADVNRAHARLQSAAHRVLQADRALRTGIINLNGNFEGLAQTSRFENVLRLMTRPQEAVYALQLLNTAYEQYFGTVAEYNRAQFDLFHALGYPADEITIRQPPGPVEPVDLSRPNFLPPVGNGPPPATR
jgi:outer membrane protein TolC